jgi:glycosyltransferase involved in cell wall biosynthesis
MSPKISVIIPTYNLAKILTERSIPSVLNQTYQNLECLVVDDGSTDDTEARVKELQKKDSRLKYFKTKNKGQSAAKNFGVEKAIGEFIAFNDHDDEYLPQYLETAIQKFKELPKEVAYLSSGVINRDENGRESYYLPELEPFWKLSIGNGWVFRRDIFKIHSIATDARISNFEDLDLHLQLRCHNYRGYIINQPLRVYYVRIRPSSSSLSLWAYYKRHTVSFDNFFFLREKDYEQFGQPAIAWLCFFGGLVHLRAGDIKVGRIFLKRSINSQLSAQAIIYLVISFLGPKLFNALDNFKNQTMRFLRAKIINRLIQGI